MKRIIGLIVIGVILALTFGCSDTHQVTAPNGEPQVPMVGNKPASLTHRPDFVDQRPDDVKNNFVLSIDLINADKKPPKPPPDTGGDDPNPNPAHKYAYIVGISDYEGTANDLQYADDDARDMRNYFTSQGFTIRMDTDRSATADAIEAGLNWLVSSAVPGDEIAFCYSGHGVKYGQYGSCLISTDLYYITNGFVFQYFNAVNCTKKIVTIDACEAGTFLSGGETGSIVATASNRTYSYDAPDLGNGAWTYYFLEGAGSNDYAEDIASYAESGMKAWARVYHVRVSPAHTDKYTGMFDI